MCRSELVSEQLLDMHSKEEGKDQELIQSSTTPNQEHHMGKCQENTTHK